MKEVNEVVSEYGIRDNIVGEIARNGGGEKKMFGGSNSHNNSSDGDGYVRICIRTCFFFGYARTKLGV